MSRSIKHKIIYDKIFLTMLTYIKGKINLQNAIKNLKQNGFSDKNITVVLKTHINNNILQIQKK